MTKIKVGSFKPEFQWNKAHRFYYIFRDGKILKPEKEQVGQCQDHRYSTGITEYFYVYNEDVIIKCEHSSHAGDEDFSLLQVYNGKVISIDDNSDMATIALKSLLAYRIGNGKDKGVITDTLRKILEIDSDIKPPVGW